MNPGQPGTEPTTGWEGRAGRRERPWTCSERGVWGGGGGVTCPGHSCLPCRIQTHHHQVKLYVTGASLQRHSRNRWGHPTPNFPTGFIGDLKMPENGGAPAMERNDLQHWGERGLTQGADSGAGPGFSSKVRARAGDLVVTILSCEYSLFPGPTPKLSLCPGSLPAPRPTGFSVSHQTDGVTPTSPTPP